MKRYQYTCKLLSDVVISSVTATEGFNPSLDYIPGAKFLGIVASKLYDNLSPGTMDLFYNGKVRFGDAYPAILGQAGFPVPSSWYHEKGENIANGSRIYLHHNLQESDITNLINSGKQLKQARKGYFSIDGHYVSIDQDFAIRSAYNRDELRSKDSQMFGYFSLPHGSTWCFTVEDDTEQYADAIKEALVGKQRIGRSRSAEYGLVEIQFEQILEIESKIIPESELTVIYALSNLCFYDSFGRSTLTPAPAQLGLSDGRILWEKSQIRSRLYQTWNRYRHNRDGDRMIIEKGSVFAITHNQPIDTKLYIEGIGSHKAEGFGQVLVNPDFLISNSIELNLRLTKVTQEDEVKATSEANKPSDKDGLVLSYLRQQKDRKTNDGDMDKLVNQFLYNNGAIFQGISPSQWGTIRAYAKHAPKWNDLEKLLFHEDFGALFRGQSESTWREKDRRGVLHKYLKTQIEESDRVAVTLKIAAEMAKRNKNEK